MKAEIIKYDNFGRGIAYLDDLITFIPYTIKGEVVLVNDIKKHKNYAEGSAKEILVSSDKRVCPVCPYYYNCGGCNLLHMEYDEAFSYKVSKVLDLFNRFKIEYKSLNKYKATHNLFYRNKISLKVVNGKIGYYKEKTHELIAIKECKLARKCLNQILKELACLNIGDGDLTLRCNNLDEVLIIAYGNISIKRDMFNEDDKIKGIIINDKVVYKDNYLITEISDYSFKYSYNSFFQVNEQMANNIFNIINKEVIGNKILDMYCGVGVLGTFAKGDNRKIYGIEIISDAVKNAKENAKKNSLFDASYKTMDALDELNELEDDFDSIIVDPPRAGLGKNTISYLKKVNPKQIIYVSCNPDSLVRNLTELKENYNVTSLNIIDMFPYTYHVECVILLQRKD